MDLHLLVMVLIPSQQAVGPVMTRPQNVPNNQVVHGQEPAVSARDQVLNQIIVLIPSLHPGVVMIQP